MLQGGLGLPDRDNYLGTAKDDVELQAKYREHIVTILKLAQIPDAEAKATRIYDLEKMMATAHATRTDSADVQKANNPWAMKDFSTKAPGLDWATYFKAAGLSGQPTIIVWQPERSYRHLRSGGQSTARCLEGISHVPRNRPRLGTSAEAFR